MGVSIRSSSYLPGRFLLLKIVASFPGFHYSSSCLPSVVSIISLRAFRRFLLIIPVISSSRGFYFPPSCLPQGIFLSQYFLPIRVYIQSLSSLPFEFSICLPRAFLCNFPSILRGAFLWRFLFIPVRAFLPRLLLLPHRPFPPIYPPSCVPLADRDYHGKVVGAHTSY